MILLEYVAVFILEKTEDCGSYSALPAIKTLISVHAIEVSVLLSTLFFF